MYRTPVAKRRLFFTPRSTAKRPRTYASASQSKAGTRYRVLNRRTTAGPKRSGTLLSQIRSLQKVVKNLCPELKYADTTITATNIPTTGFIQHITPISQGDTQSTRTGNTIDVTSISVRGSFAGASDIAIVSYMRCAVVIDKQQVADTAPTAGAIFSPNDPVGALPNVDNLERFRVLWLSPVFDARRMYLDVDNTTAPPTQSAYVDWTWKGNVKVSFNGTAGTDMMKNNCYFVILSDIAAATSDFSGVARIGFTDV